MPIADQSPAERAARGSSPFRDVLVAVDGSDAAGAAASFAIWLAGTAGADVTLVHVCPDLGGAEHAAPRADPAAFRAAAEHRLQETARWQRRLQNLAGYAVAGAHVQTRVVRGRVSAAVLEAGDELDADVIFIGSRGRGADRSQLLGSVSSQVLHHARRSVMVFPAQGGSSPANTAGVVVGVDGSPSSAAAVAAGSELAAALGAKLVLLSAYDTYALTPELEHWLRADAVATLDAARARVTADVEVVEQLREGPPREALLAAAERFGPAVLAVGSRGLGGFEGLLLGSTSRWLLHHAACPILVARSRP
jgi:nucleotide-binding universal stress UspA family protein